jgi:hypothetical protein
MKDFVKLSEHAGMSKKEIYHMYRVQGVEACYCALKQGFFLFDLGNVTTLSTIQK